MNRRTPNGCGILFAGKTAGRTPIRPWAADCASGNLSAEVGDISMRRRLATLVACSAVLVVGAYLSAADNTMNTTSGSTHIVRSRDLVGMKVYNKQDQDLGKIEDLVLDPNSGKIQYTVLTSGGFIGMGTKYFAVPWNVLQLVLLSKDTTTRFGTVKEDHFVLDISKEALRTAPGIDKDNWPEVADQNWQQIQNANRQVSSGTTTR
jgi:sporulation protein YlmC with PRC-barrel domain